jgi:protein SMG6
MLCSSFLRDTRPRPKSDRPAQFASAKPQDSPREKPPKNEFVREKSQQRDEFARNMPAPSTTTRLFNPNFDSIPVRRTQEPEVMSDIGSGSPPKGVSTRAAQQRPDPSSSRRLFDPKRDPPVRFAVLTRPAGVSAEKPAPSHRSSGDYVSASSTSISSYPPSLGSSAFTLTSASSSSSSAPFSKEKEDPNSPVVAQLKKLYRQISQAERKLLDDKQDDAIDEPARVVVQSREHPITEAPDPWSRLISEHKESVPAACMI